MRAQVVERVEGRTAAKKHNGAACDLQGHPPALGKVGITRGSPEAHLSLFRGLARHRFNATGTTPPLAIGIELEDLIVKLVKPPNHGLMIICEGHMGRTC